MNSVQLRTVLAPFKIKQVKYMPRTQNDLLICYFQWIHVEKRQRRVTDGEEQNLNAGNLTDCADKQVSDCVVDEFISTAINSGDQTDFSEDDDCGLIPTINAGNPTDCADNLISKYAADGLISTAVDAGNSIDCADDSAGGLIDAINVGISMDCAYFRFQTMQRMG